MGIARCIDITGQANLCGQKTMAMKHGRLVAR